MGALLQRIPSWPWVGKVQLSSPDVAGVQLPPDPTCAAADDEERRKSQTHSNRRTKPSQVQTMWLPMQAVTLLPWPSTNKKMLNVLHCIPTAFLVLLGLWFNTPVLGRLSQRRNQMKNMCSLTKICLLREGKPGALLQE